jgi:hypothetical protein
MRNLFARNGRIVGVVASWALFAFVAPRAPIVPWYLACCVALGLLVGISQLFLVDVEEEPRPEISALKVTGTALLFTVIFFDDGRLTSLFFPEPQDKQFYSLLMVEAFSVTLTTACGAIIGREFFKRSHTAQNEAASTRS